ncbi:DNA polymerase iota isoform X1 [Oryzias latipes]|uniref:DNA polymerase iota isoform X1 n=1 Tax=Oryzias latipes TaxID=8090 RepID=UPI0005CC26F7|nr:DNA polymerase iota isoform X1 [Oryzias latipes]
MDSSDEEMDGDDGQWRSQFTGPEEPATSGWSVNNPPGAPHRVILHFDLDCFYAQVEMIRDPSLREVPLGIQQKYIIVTCNYVARERGVTKLMSVTDAKEKCPELVLVRGEDLTLYREASHQVTELLSSFCPLVERLGFDENFMDVTEMVERRMKETPPPEGYSFSGHVYNPSNAEISGSDHPRLALGSYIAAELRDAVHSRLGLTGCAGVATNKLLAKLVSGTFKPNQQTVLLPEDVGHIMESLGGVRKVPGVGHQTAKKLHQLGVVSVKDLQLLPLPDLVKEFGGAVARRLRNLSLGVDDSPVTPSGAPQSLSDEDSFKKMSSEAEVVEKIQQLLSRLVERMQKDGRQPQTFRLTIRRYTPTNKWFSRESRQCPIPSHLGQKILSGATEDAVLPLVSLAMKLFHKMVDGGSAFHLTLINVCFSNLQSRAAGAGGKGAITAFFPRRSQNQDSAPSIDGRRSGHGVPPAPTGSSSGSEGEFGGLERNQSFFETLLERTDIPRSTQGCGFNEATRTPSQRLPADVDPEVFGALPEEIQKELLGSAHLNSSTCPSIADALRLPTNKPPKTFTDSEGNKFWKDPSPADPATAVGPERLAGTRTLTERAAFPPSSDRELPGNVDPLVFSQLPLGIQRELRSEWRQQKPVLKVPSSKGSGRRSQGKDPKAVGGSSQHNNLLKYFKRS